MKRIYWLALVLALVGLVFTASLAFAETHRSIAVDSDLGGLPADDGLLQADHVLINEFIATPTAAEAIELYNPTGTAVDVSGWTIDWVYGSTTINAGQTVPADGYLVVDDTNTGGISISNDGTVLSLMDGTLLIDQVGYGDDGGCPKPIYNFSAARAPDGADTNDDAADFNLDTTPTMGAANDNPAAALGLSSVRINEIMPNDVYAEEGVAFVELHNDSDTAVDIGGYMLQVDDDYYIAAGVSIGPRGFYTVSGTALNVTAPFLNLDYAQDNLYLYDDTGVRTDQVGWDGRNDVVANGESFQRIPDAAGPYNGYSWSTSGGDVTLFQLSPTQGYTNELDVSLTIDKEGPEAVIEGDVVTYTITFGNLGTSDAENVVISDVLPISVTYGGFVSYTTDLTFTGTITEPAWDAGTVVSNSSGLTFTVWVTFTGPFTNGQQVANHMYIETTTPGVSGGQDILTHTVFTGYVPIATARMGSDGEVFAIEGRVVYTPGTYNTNGWGLQDSSGGIGVYYTPPPLVALGDQIRLIATRSSFNNEEQMAAPVYDFVNLGGGPEVEPQAYDSGDVATGSTEGWLVVITGTVSGLSDCTGNYSFFVDDGSGPAYVYVDSDTGVDVCAMGIENGDTVRVVGFSTQYQSTYEIKPRRPADVQELYLVTFVYHDLEDVAYTGEDVYVAGTFNGWDANATPLNANGDYSVFSVTLTLDMTGTHEYKYIVKSGGDQWDWLQRPGSAGNRSVDVNNSLTVDDYRDVAVGYAHLINPPAITILLGETTEPISGEVWINNVTNLPGVGRGVLANLGYGMDPDPALWGWTAMTYVGQGGEYGNNDVFTDTLTPLAGGVYSYAVRFDGNWGAGNPNAGWTYGDLDGDPFELANAGVLTVTAPSLAVSKDVTPSADVDLGGVVTYTLVLSNSGDGAALGVVLTDALPAALDFGGWLQQNGAIEANDTLTWTGDIPLGTQVVIAFTATVGTDQALYGQTITNTVSYTSANGGSGEDAAAFTIIEKFHYYLPIVFKNY